MFLVADGSAPPFVGYGPYLVIIRGDSGVFHLLAHLDPSGAGAAPMGSRVTEGQVIGRTSSANHTHWEVRRSPVPPSGKTNLDNNLDPIAWMNGGSILFLAAVAAGGFVLWKLYTGRR